jgi:heat shock protein HslJ
VNGSQWEHLGARNRPSAMRRRLLPLVTAGVLASACGEPGTDASGPNDDVASYLGTWELVEGSGPGGRISLPPDGRITFLIEDDSIGGIAACNRYGTGDFTIDGHDFDAREGVSLTEMACAKDLMAAESAYIDAFVAADRIDRHGDTLTLSGPRVELTYGFVPPPPTADLVGTKWVLESLLLDSGADAVAMSAEPAELRLEGDGTVTGTTGCRRMEGTWRRNGDEIVFPSLAADGECPEERSQQDGFVVSIGDGFTFEIEGDALTIDPYLGEVRLVYRSATD